MVHAFGGSNPSRATTENKSREINQNQNLIENPQKSKNKMHSNQFNYLKIPHAFHIFRKGIYSLYIAHAIRGFVASLIGFFIPIYFYKIGLNIPEILLYYIITYFFIILFSIVVGGIGNKVGLKHTMIISLPLYLLYLGGIMLLKKYPSPTFLYSLAIFGAFISALYWVPLHCLFVRLSSNKNQDKQKQVGLLFSVRSLGSMIAPLLGGLISILFGFEALFATAIFILIIPIIILLNSKDIHPHINFSSADLWLFFRKHTRLFIIILLDAFATFADDIIWPLLVFLILRDTVSVGVVGSLIGVGTIVFTLIIGKIIAKNDWQRIIKVSAFMLAFLWIVKAFFANEKISIYTISLVAAMFALMFSVPLSSKTYSLAKRNKNLDEFIVFRQMVVYLGRLMAVFFAIILVSQLNISLLLSGVAYFIISLF